MILKSFKYVRERGKPNEWKLVGSPNDNSPLELGRTNLIVGKNASGKSNTIKALLNLADLLSGDKQIKNLEIQSFSYEVTFEANTNVYIYELDVVDGMVVGENLSVGGKRLLDRSKGKLYYSKLDQYLDFKIDGSVIAVTRRDTEQQPYFDDLFIWARRSTAYHFGSSMGKNLLVRDVEALLKEGSFNERDTDKVAGLYAKAMREVPQIREMVVEDMRKIDYEIEDVTSSHLRHFPVEAFGISVKEKDLKDVTEQLEMSQGMFRSLALLAQLNFSFYRKNPSCILIDDIGEGLDYTRSTKLIGLLIEKAKASGVQLIMSTNDRYVMNKVPLDYWHVIWREANKSIFYNKKNSPEFFEQFAFMGLNNFDFFATQFFRKGLQEVGEDELDTEIGAKDD